MPADLPSGVNITYAQQYRRCGKPDCPVCATGARGHGPYWYAYWREAGRPRTRYLGKHLPAGLGPVPAPAEMPISATGSSARDPAQLRVQTLGGFRVWLGDQQVPEGRWRRRTVAALFKCLISAPEYRLPREQVAEWLWPEAKPSTGAGNLRVMVHLLRRVLDEDEGAESAIRYDGDALILAPSRPGQPSADWLDAAAFARLARAALAGRDLSPGRSALALYGGDYLPSDPYEEWAVRRREELCQLHVTLLLHMADLGAGQGALDEAIGWVQAVLAADPCHEEAARRLMGLQHARGRRTEGIRTYRRLVEALREELALEPEPETRQLYQALLASRSAVSAGGRTDADAPIGPVQPELEMPSPLTEQIPLVGRMAEFATLTRALEQARAGVGSLILLRGPAGAGKSRLLREVVDVALAQRALVLLGRAYRQEGQLPYGPIQEAVRSYVLAQPDHLLRKQVAYHAVLARLVPDLARVLPELPTPAPLEPRAERHRLFAALAGLFQELCRTGPVLLALEDLHWADLTTLQVLHYLQRNSQRLPLLILGTYRDDEAGAADPLEGLRGMQGAAVLDVVPLGQEASSALVQALLGSEPVATDVQELVGGKALGNPLFTVELLATLRERGRLAKQDGAWRLVGDGPLPIPAGIQALVAGRVHRLSTTPGQLVRLCAVLGGAMDYAILHRASDLSETALIDGLDALLDAGLLQETPQGYTFSHPLLAEAIYQWLPARRRVLLHRRSGEALEIYYARQALPHAAALAWHFGEAGCHPQAAFYGQAAGDRAAAAYANAEAVAHYRRARQHLEQIHAADAEIAHLDEQLGDLYLLEGSYAAAQERFALARAATGDASRRAVLWRKESLTWERRAEFERALAALDAADAEAVALPNEQRASLIVSRGLVQYHRGEFSAATAAGEQALALLGDEPEGPVLAQAYQLLANVVGDQGEHARAEAWYQRSLAIRQGHGKGAYDLQESAACLNSLGCMAYDRGAYAEAVAYQQRCIAIWEQIGDQRGMGVSWNNLGNIAYDLGDLATAIERYERALAIMERLGESGNVAVICSNLGAIAVAHGKLPLADACYRRSLELNERSGDLGSAGAAWVGLGEVALVRGDLPQAHDYHLRGLPLIEETGRQDWIATTWIGLAEIAHRRGALTPAAASYRRAYRMALQIAAPDVQAQATLGLAHVHLSYASDCPRRLRLVGALLVRVHTLIAAHNLAQARMDAALLEAELQLRRGALLDAQALAEDALQLAARSQRRREGGFAQRLLGQCAVAAGDLLEAETYLRAAARILEEAGARLEVARTQLLLARALLLRPDPDLPGEVRTLLAAAHTTFAASGAQLDQAQAASMLSSR